MPLEISAIGSCPGRQLVKPSSLQAPLTVDTRLRSPEFCLPGLFPLTRDPFTEGLRVECSEELVVNRIQRVPGRVADDCIKACTVEHDLRKLKSPVEEMTALGNP